MAGIGHMSRKATDNLSVEAWDLMKRGFSNKKPSTVIAREIADATGEKVNSRTIGRRAIEWRREMDRRQGKLEDMKALVAAAKEGDLDSSGMIQALAMQSLLNDPDGFTKQNPLKVQSQNLRAEEISLKREALRLKQREVAVSEARLRLLQERERKALEVVAELKTKSAQGKSITVEDMSRIRQIYGLSA